MNIIYAEDWVIAKLPEAFLQQPHTKFTKWPPEEAPSELIAQT